MSDDDAVSLHAHGSATGRQEVVQEWASEASRGKFHGLKFLRISQSPHAIADEHEPISIHDPTTSRALWKAEGVLDDLEHHVKRRQREHAHHGALIPLGDLEPRI